MNDIYETNYYINTILEKICTLERYSYTIKLFYEKSPSGITANEISDE